MINSNNPAYQQIRAVTASVMNNDVDLQGALVLFEAIAKNLEREAKSTHDGVHKCITDSLNAVYKMNEREAG
jgi:hypothetical protein